MRVTILGCASSAGVPSISKGFGNCNPLNPLNRRTRSSALIEDNGSRLLIDAGPDLREQFIRENIKALNGVLITHEHYDHTGGIVDLRDINRLMGGILNLYGEEKTITSIKERFAFIFQKPIMLGDLFLTPYMNANIIKSNAQYEIAGFKVTACAMKHGPIISYGYRINDFGYLTDFATIIDDYRSIFKGIKKLVISCQSIRMEKNDLHATFDEIMGLIKEFNVEKAYLTHMCPSVDYDYVKTIIPANTEPAFDGLAFDV